MPSLTLTYILAYEHIKAKVYRHGSSAQQHKLVPKKAVTQVPHIKTKINLC